MHWRLENAGTLILFAVLFVFFLLYCSSVYHPTPVPVNPTPVLYNPTPAQAALSEVSLQSSGDNPQPTRVAYSDSNPPATGFVLIPNPTSTRELSGQVHRATLAADLNQLAKVMLAQIAAENWPVQEISLLEKNTDFPMQSDPIWGYYPWQYVQQLQIIDYDWQSGQQLTRFTVLTRLLDENDEQIGYVFSAVVRPDLISQLDCQEFKVAHFVIDDGLIAHLNELQQQISYDDTPLRTSETLLSDELVDLNQRANGFNNNKMIFFIVGAPDPGKDSRLEAYPDYFYIDINTPQQIGAPQATADHLQELRTKFDNQYFIITQMEINPHR